MEDLNTELPKSSLRSRAWKFIALSSVFIISFYTVMLYLIYIWGLGESTRGVFLQEAQLFIEAYKKDVNATLPNTRTLQGFIGKENLPPKITELFPPTTKCFHFYGEDCFHYKARKVEDSELHYHLYSTSLPDTDKKLYIFYELDVSTKVSNAVWQNFKILALCGGAVVIILLLILVRIILKTIAPLSDLSKWIQDLNEDAPPSALPKSFVNDEVGEVANRLFDALQRINQHNTLEKQFLRNASHELRTPIAIIRNAMDVLEHKRLKGIDDLDSALQRIRRASNSMKSVTEAILWLAKENYAAPYKESFNVSKLILQLVEENAQVTPNKNINVRCELDALGTLDTEKALLHIALDNIIRNAFQYCTTGELAIIALSSHCVEVINLAPSYVDTTLTELDAEHAIQTGGFGLGLALVEKISKKQQWLFEFTITGEKARSRLDFSHIPDRG